MRRKCYRPPLQLSVGGTEAFTSGLRITVAYTVVTLQYSANTRTRVHEVSSGNLVNVAVSLFEEDVVCQSS